MTETAQAGMSVYNLNLFPDDNVSKHREKGKDRRHGRFPIYNEERHMVHLESICEISHPCSPLIRVGNDDDLMATVDEFLDLVSNFSSSYKAQHRGRFRTVDSW